MKEKLATSFKIAETDEVKGEFVGYASVFGSTARGARGPTRFSHGAFKKTLEERGSRVKILWQHDEHQPIGKPLALREDDQGLYLHGKISPTTLGKDTITLMKDGVIDELSIGFDAVQSHYEKQAEGNLRIVTEARLYEISPVTFAADPSARVRSVQSLFGASAAVAEEILSGMEDDKRELVMRALESFMTDNREVQEGRMFSAVNTQHLKDVFVGLLSLVSKADGKFVADVANYIDLDDGDWDDPDGPAKDAANCEGPTKADAGTGLTPTPLPDPNKNNRADGDAKVFVPQGPFLMEAALNIAKLTGIEIEARELLGEDFDDAEMSANFTSESPTATTVDEPHPDGDPRLHANYKSHALAMKGKSLSDLQGELDHSQTMASKSHKHADALHKQASALSGTYGGYSDAAGLHSAASSHRSAANDHEARAAAAVDEIRKRGGKLSLDLSDETLDSGDHFVKQNGGKFHVIEKKTGRVKSTHDSKDDAVAAKAKADGVEKNAARSGAATNDLPDSCFAVIESGGTKDDGGKTTPRSLRHLPYKKADGSIDLPHLRNALARVSQTDISAEDKARAKKKLEAAAKSAGVGGEGNAEGEGPPMDPPEDITDNNTLPKTPEAPRRGKRAKGGTGGMPMGDYSDAMKNIRKNVKAAIDAQ